MRPPEVALAVVLVIMVGVVVAAVDAKLTARLIERETDLAFMAADIRRQSAKLDALHRQIDDFEMLVAELKVHWDVRRMTVTAYAPHDPDAVVGMCHDGDPTKTSTGSYPGFGTIAVDPAVIPYGTLLFVESYGWGIASDTGATIRRNNWLDVCVASLEDAKEWGVRQVWVAIRRP